MRKLIAIMIASLWTYSSYAQKPAGLSPYTWTREDIFAGLIGGDYERLNVGMKKIEDLLKQNPNDTGTIAMKAAGLSALAIRDLGKGDTAAFDKQYGEAIRLLDEAYKTDPKDVGVNAVYGGVTLYNYGKLPEQRRRHALEMARRSYNTLFTLQQPELDNLPLHLKGEVLAGVAEAEFRSGNKQQAEGYLKRIVETMPNTAYAQRAQQWISNPQSVTATNRLICQSCHDAGRLSNVLAGKRGQ